MVGAWWVSLLAMLVARVSVLVAAIDIDTVTSGDFEVVRMILRRDALQHGLALLTTSLALVIVSQISTGLRRDLD